MSYADRVLRQTGLIQSSRTEIGTYKCTFCNSKEYFHYSHLSRHKKICEMNPERKRQKTEAEEEAEEEMDLHRKAASRVFKAVMATDCTDKLATKKKMKHLEPLATGLLYQKLVDMDTQFHRDSEEYEAKKRENDKVKLVIKYLDGDSSPQVSSSSSGGGAASSGGGAASGGGSGIMGYFSSAKK